MLKSVAIWSMNAPVPPAQEPFMRASMAPCKNSIFASSPPSSMITSVAGAFFSADTLVAYTSWTKSMELLSAIPIPAEPEITRPNSSVPANRSRIFSSASTVLAVIWEKCLS